MLLFCPICSNAVVVEAGDGSSNRFVCNTCPYQHTIGRIYGAKRYTIMKQMDDVLGGEEAWEFAPVTMTTCPKCHCREAFFRQMQTRSADEPMTTFYKCKNFKDCGNVWRGD
ncbi:DNA-directed RNA polymerase III subunit RPC10 [Sphaeroforma arctica JP610]|uniref:DNA-directed RNA polymerase subunit n=1 Tax=Sphaeroforma arctica JP610 TaxID=667725 RepID=A0A0L0GAZ6_9EUKA|nr:DNA-directed RNA polymerase III subunit RPC10 [Sphaeroforma arctica JP610]KNC86170.1 DNA-directed RNA polymerase III subunit RPC10 [Sphaeroforma arctica JP610]|eukprot:XP_014160072.1 DNA-directed RNA polymerase III subunit RPC10 [Sphaeroforma arctica JP610]